MADELVRMRVSAKLLMVAVFGDRFRRAFARGFLRGRVERKLLDWGLTAEAHQIERWKRRYAKATEPPSQGKG